MGKESRGGVDGGGDWITVDHVDAIKYLEGVLLLA